jgi:hypothetical protein
MLTAEHCQARADEAEALSHTVAYERDRVRLREEARSWREAASRAQAHAEFWDRPEPPSPLSHLLGWLRGR